jgi:hypothetical protein
MLPPNKKSGQQKANPLQNGSEKKLISKVQEAIMISDHLQVSGE